MPTIKLQVRRDTAINWTSSNPFLLQGEIGFEIDTGKVKIGRQVSQAWNSIPYISSSILSIDDVPGLTSALDSKATVTALNSLSGIVDSKLDTSQLTAVQTHLEELISDAVAQLEQQITNSTSDQGGETLAMIIALGD